MVNLIYTWTSLKTCIELYIRIQLSHTNKDFLDLPLKIYVLYRVISLNNV